MNLPPIVIDGHVIPLSDGIKNLGVHLSPDLAWNDHVSSIIRRVNAVLFNFTSEARGLPRQVRKQLVQSLVLPHLDYAAVAFVTLPGVLEARLAQLQNRGIRFIFGLKPGTPTSSWRRELGWLTTSGRRKQLLGIQIYNVLTKKRPYPLYEKLLPLFNSPNAEYELRPSTSRPFKVPIPRTQSFAQSFTYSTILFWNELPDVIRNADSLEIFKRRVYKHLFALEA